MKKVLLILLLTLISTTSFAQQNEDEKWHKLSLTDSIELQKTWTEFKTALENNDAIKIKNLSLKKVDCILCFERNGKSAPPKDYVVTIERFIKHSAKSFKGSPLAKAIKTSGYFAQFRTLYDCKPRNLPAGYGKNLTIYELYIQTYKPDEWAKGHEGQSHVFQFVKVNGEFKFFGMTSIP